MKLDRDVSIAAPSLCTNLLASAEPLLTEPFVPHNTEVVSVVYALCMRKVKVLTQSLYVTPLTFALSLASTLTKLNSTNAVKPTFCKFHSGSTFEAPCICFILLLRSQGNSFLTTTASTHTYHSQPHPLIHSLSYPSYRPHKFLHHHLHPLRPLRPRPRFSLTRLLSGRKSSRPPGQPFHLLLLPAAQPCPPPTRQATLLPRLSCFLSRGCASPPKRHPNLLS